MAQAVLVDVTKCIGCRGCQVACKQWNELAAETTPFTGGANPANTSADTWTRVGFYDVQREDGAPVWRQAKFQCMHCNEPACASACPVTALTKTPEGPVVYDSDKCIGCRYCAIACPFGVPSFEWEKPLALMRKCQMCYDRIKAGLEPACVTACPTAALTFGDRAALLAQAQQKLVSQPAKYINYVYSQDEVGGTSWLYISDVPHDQIGLNTRVVKQPLPPFTWAAMAKVPWIIAGGSLLLSGVYWYTHRRTTLAGSKEG